MLQKVILSGDFEKAKELLSAGEKLPDNIQDYQKAQIFDKIIRSKEYDLVNLFVSNNDLETDIYEYDSFDKTIFASIVKHLHNDTEGLAFLNTFLPQIQNLNDELEGKSLLSYAIENQSHPDIIKTLLAHDCDVNIISGKEENLIHQIVKKYASSFERGLEYLQLLRDEGLEIDQPNSSGKTPLILAVELHRNEYVEWLLENGANPNAVDKNGKSAFFIAIADQADHDKYKMMRSYGKPEFDRPNNDGETMFCECLRMTHSINEPSLNLIKMLLEDGADPYTGSSHYGEITAIDMIAKKPSEILKTVIGNFSLDVNQKDDEGNTLLHKICDHDSNHDHKTAKETYKKVKILLEAGAQIDVSNSKEETPLMLASKDNLKTKTVELLLTYK